MENETNSQIENPAKSRFNRWFERNAGRPIKTSDKIIAAIFIVIFLFVFYVFLDANKYRAMAHVIAGEGKVGINPLTDSLDFGDLSRGTSAVRRVDLKNGIAVPVYVIIWETGDLSDLMKESKNFFVLKPGTEEKVEFSTYIPASAEIGKNYTGRVYLFKIPIL